VSAPALAGLRVLLVDDSVASQGELARVLEDEGGEIVGQARDGEQALQVALALRPEVIILDLEMPRMDGFTFLRLLMSRQPTPVIVLSARSRPLDVLRTLELGAFDFVAKPRRPNLSAVRQELLEKCQEVRALRMDNLRPGSARDHDPARGRPAIEPGRVVVLGASAGGPRALQALLAALPVDLAAAILVAQHMPEGFTSAFAERLARTTPFAVSQAEDGDQLAQGRVLVAPGGRHLELRREAGADGALRARLAPRATDGSASRPCPSVDRLFASAALAVPRRLCAAVLTGMGSDGAAGIRAVKAAGGLTLAESAETAVIFGMPGAARASGALDELLPLPELAARIARFARGG
jgi:two-component system chemotaxis response regulator CheB